MTETKSKCLIKKPIISFLVACNFLGLALSLSWSIWTFLIWFENIFELNGYVNIIRNAFRVFPSLWTLQESLFARKEKINWSVLYWIFLPVSWINLKSQSTDESMIESLTTNLLKQTAKVQWSGRPPALSCWKDPSVYFMPL